MTELFRTIEIDLLQQLGETSLPEPTNPIKTSFSEIAKNENSKLSNGSHYITPKKHKKFKQLVQATTEVSYKNIYIYRLYKQSVVDNMVGGDGSTYPDETVTHRMEVKMYGIVNQAIEGLVTENYGKEAWDKILETSGVNIRNFISNESYDDDVTYQLAGAASKVLEITLEQVLEAFGRYWVLNTGLKKYGNMMKSGGSNFEEFMHNLPNFHTRVALIYPALQPPEFTVEGDGKGRMFLNYYSGRQGLSHFVIGLMYGLGDLYGETVAVQQIAFKANGDNNDKFLVTW